MVLSDYDLKQNADELVVPFDPRNVSPASIDLTLAADPADRFNKKGEMRLKPNEFILLRTAETVKVPEYLVAVVKGKSSIARLGVMVECAGFVDPGFRGTITLEVKKPHRQAYHSEGWAEDLPNYLLATYPSRYQTV